MSRKSIILTLAMFLCASVPGHAAEVISIGTAPAGGAWYGIGGAMAQVITQHAGATAVAEVTGAAVDNVKLLGTGQIEMGFTISVIGEKGYLGKPPFQHKYSNIRTLLSSIQAGYLQIVTLKSSGLTYVDQLKGKRVAVGPSGHGSLVQLKEIFGELGFGFGDIKPVYMPYEQSITALGDGKVDAAVLYVAPPAPAIKQFSVNHDIRLLALKKDEQSALVKKFGHYIAKTIPKATYDGLPGDVPTVATANIVMVDAKLDDDLVYRITKAIFENIDEIRASHPSAKAFSIEDAVLGSPIPFHPGAMRYYKERGIWQP